MGPPEHVALDGDRLARAINLFTSGGILVEHSWPLRSAPGIPAGRGRRKVPIMSLARSPDLPEGFDAPRRAGTVTVLFTHSGSSVCLRRRLVGRHPDILARNTAVFVATRRGAVAHKLPDRVWVTNNEQLFA